MKIAIAIEAVSRGGGQDRVVCELATRLCKRHDMHIFCFEANDLPPEVTVHQLDFPLSTRPIMREIGIVEASRRAIEPNEFDFVMAQGGNCPRANCSLIHMDLLTRYEYLRNDLWRRYPEGRLTGVLRAAWHRRTIRLLRDTVRRLPGRCLAVSGALAQQVAKSCQVAEDTIIPVPNGVDHAEFGPHLKQHREVLREEIGIPPEAFVVLFVGGRWVEKGVPLLIEALNMTRSDHLHLAVIGGGEPPEMQRLAADDTVRRRLHFPGRKKPVAPYFGIADCFALPSYSEGFSLVSLEAAACGLPLIMTPVGAEPELVIEGETGCLVPHNPARIAEKLDILAADPELAARMSRSVLAHSQNYSWDRQAQEIEQILQNWYEADRGEIHAD